MPFRCRVRTMMITVALFAMVLAMMAGVREQERRKRRQWSEYRAALANREEERQAEHARRAREAEDLAEDYLIQADQKPDRSRLFHARAKELTRAARREAELAGPGGR